MEDPHWVKKFKAAERPGLYVRVIKQGTIKAGDEVRVEKYTDETVSIVQMYRDHYVKEYTEETLRRYLNSPIDVRSRKFLEEELQRVS
jgi:MOSC domain-containing protein YiiM